MSKQVVDIPSLMEAVYYGKKQIETLKEGGLEVPAEVYERQLAMHEELLDALTGGEQK